MIDDNGVLINPECKGITFVFKIVRTWDDQILFEIPDLENTKSSKDFWGNIFKSMAQTLLDD